MNEKPENHGRRTISDDERDYLDGWAAHVSRSVSESERSRSKRKKSRDRSERSSRSRSPRSRSRSRDRRDSRDSRERIPGVERGERKSGSEFQIYVGTFSDAAITDDQIWERFQEYGNVVGLQRPINSQWSGKAAYCFVTFDCEGPVYQLAKKGSVSVAGQRVQVKKAWSRDDKHGRTRSSSRERKMKRKKDKRRNNSREDSSDRSRGRKRRHRFGRSRSRSRTRSRTRSHTRSRTRSRTWLPDD